MQRSRQLQKIISGGQTGVDRAALDAALGCDFACGGWCPKGRLAEDGTLSQRYPLHETPTDRYPQRTEWNVRDSDATLVLTRGPLTGGTRLTVELARRLGRPSLVVELEGSTEVEAAAQWLRSNRICTLNVAGPRESTQVGIYAEARQFMSRLLAQLKEPQRG